MLFNSYEFICVFLPVTLVGLMIVGRRPGYAVLWLAVASVAFYGYWSTDSLPILATSVVVNFLSGRGLALLRNQRARRALLLAGLSFDFGLLGYYKYYNFFVDVAGHAAGLSGMDEIVLPIGISFFTFTQAAYLIDAYRNEASEPSFASYLLFVTYFPHLIAGPILHHKEMMPQFARTFRFDGALFASGCSLFVVGLAKKVLCADSLAPIVSKLFALAATTPLTMGEAWVAAIAYTLQIYFDFSGYSDMALALGLMIGVRLPMNFYSPYKADSIIDFWRRWHMTLSRFLRDYLYIPLGGNRRGEGRRLANLMTTMLLGGLWHGAGWTFVIWGGLHGFYLIVNHLWQGTGLRMPRVAARCLTLLAVTVAWVFFRADDVESATRIVRAMSGGNGVVLPAAAVALLPNQLVDLAGVTAGAAFGNGAVSYTALAIMFALAIVALGLPNSLEIFAKCRPALEPTPRPAGRVLTWTPSISWAILLGVLFALCVSKINGPSPFLYFQF